MPDIKTKAFAQAKDTLDAASDIGKRMRHSMTRTEERARILTDSGQDSSTEYAADQLLDTEEDVVYDVGYIAIDTFNLSRRTMVKAIRTSQSRSESDTEGETPLEDSPTVPTDNQVANPSTPDTVDSLQPSPEAHQPPVSTPQQPTTNIQNATPPRNVSTRTVERALHNGLPSMQSSPKPRNTTIKTAQRTVKDSSRTIKTTRDVGKTSAKAAHKSAQTAQNASHRVAGFLDKTARATVTLGKAVTNAAKSIVTYIASGGWIILLVVSIIIIIIVIIAAAAGYLDPSITIPE